MSCPWIENHEVIRAEEIEDTEVWTTQMGTYDADPGYKVTQHNIIMDILGRYSKDMVKSMKRLVGERSKVVLKQMQKAAIEYFEQFKKL